MSNDNPAGEEKKKGFPRLSEAILAVLIPFAGYYIAYTYSCGYARYFGISSSFVEVGLAEVLSVMGILIFLYLMIFGVLGNKEDLAKAKNPVLRAFSRIFVPSLIVLVLITYSRYAGILLYVFLVYLCLVIFTEFFYPLISQRKSSGYKNKLVEQEKNDRARNLEDSSLLGPFRRKYGLREYVAIILLLISIFYMSSIGAVNAMTKTSFEVLKSTPELVVLAKYSNRLICAEFDRDNKEVNNAFYIRTLDQIAEQRTKIVIEAIGPLKVKGRKGRGLL